MRRLESRANARDSGGRVDTIQRAGALQGLDDRLEVRRVADYASVERVDARAAGFAALSCNGADGFLELGTSLGVGGNVVKLQRFPYTSCRAEFSFGKALARTAILHKAHARLLQLCLAL